MYSTDSTWEGEFQKISWDVSGDLKMNYLVDGIPKWKKIYVTETEGEKKNIWDTLKYDLFKDWSNKFGKKKNVLGFE